jgi:hypothetical protein
MRPRKQVLILGQSHDAVGELAFALSTSIHVKVDRNLNPRSFTKALKAKPYDLVLLLSPGTSREALTKLAHPMPVLTTTGERTEGNAQFFDTCKVLLARKRGPRKAEYPEDVIARVNTLRAGGAIIRDIAKDVHISQVSIGRIIRQSAATQEAA